jgi:hypothetical protein
MGVSRGDAGINLPDQVYVSAPGDYSYGFSGRRISLVPEAREIDFVMDLDRKVNDHLSLGASGLVMSNPHHVDKAPVGFAATGRLKLVF